MPKNVLIKERNICETNEETIEEINIFAKTVAGRGCAPLRQLVDLLITSGGGAHSFVGNGRGEPLADL